MTLEERDNQIEWKMSSVVMLCNDYEKLGGN